MAVTKEIVVERLKTVNGPDFEGNIVDLGMVSDIFISDGKVYFSITVPAERAKELEPLRAAAERVVKDIPGVKGAIVALTADKKGGAPAARPPAPSAPPAPRRSIHAPRIARHAHAMRRQPRARRQDRRSRRRRDHRRRLGQGRRRQVDHRRQPRAGLQANGLRVGILDADIYGPSMPRLLKHLRPAASRSTARSSSRWRITASRSCRWASSSTRRRR